MSRPAPTHTIRCLPPFGSETAGWRDCDLADCKGDRYTPKFLLDAGTGQETVICAECLMDGALARFDREEQKKEVTP